MKVRSTLLVALALCLSLSCGARAENSADLLQILPDDTDMVILIRNVPDFLASWPESPFGKLWNDPDFKQFTAPMREEMEIERWDDLIQEETGYTFADIAGQFTGQIAIIFPDFADWIPDEDDSDAETDPGESEDNEEEDGNDFDGPLAMVANVGSNTDLIEGLLARDLQDQQGKADPGEEIREIEEEFQGEILHLRETVTGDETVETEGWAIVGNVAIMAQPRDYLQEMVARLKRSEQSGSLAETAHFRKMQRHVPDYDVLAYVNLADIIALFRQTAEAEMMADPSGMPFQPSQLFNALALESLESAFLTVRQTETETAMDFGILYTEDVGLMKMLAYRPGPCPRLAFLPADAMSVSVQKFSMQEMIAALKEMIANVDPSLGMMVEMQLQQFTTQLGVDIEKDIIGSFGDEIFSTMAAAPGVTPTLQPDMQSFDQVMGISVKDRQTLELALSNLLTAVGAGAEMFEKKDFLGTTIHTLKPPIPSEQPGTAPTRMAYAFAGDYFLLSIGSDASLRSVLTGMRSPGKSIWERDDVAAALDVLPRDASCIVYYDVAALINYSLQMFIAGMKSQGEDAEIPDLGELPDPKKIARYFGPAVGAVTKGSDGFISTSRIMHPVQ